MKVRYAKAALFDLRSIRRHIAADSPSAADRMYLRLIDACEALDAFPLRGRKGRARGTRELVSISPYIIIYVVEPRGVRITRIRHAAEDR